MKMLVHEQQRLDYLHKYVKGFDKTAKTLKRVVHMEADPAAPKVSVVIPVYNIGERVRRAIKSVLDQTLQEIEVICVDDGSVDSSMSVLCKCAAEDSRVVVLEHVRNLGTHMARKTGTLVARGAYVTYLDADDRLAAESCQALYDVAVREQADMVHGMTQIEGGGNLPAERLSNMMDLLRPYSGVVEGSSILSFGYIERTISSNLCTKLYTRDLVVKAFSALPDIRAVVAEDIMASFAIMAFARKYIPTQIEFYRYSYGMGVTGKQDISLEDFKKSCQCVDTLRALETFVDGPGKAHPYAHDALAAYRLRILNESRGRIESLLRTDRERIDGYRYLEEKLGSREFVAYLAERFFDLRDVPISRFERLGMISRVKAGKVRRVGLMDYGPSVGGARLDTLRLAEEWRTAGFEVVFLFERPPAGGRFQPPADARVVILPQAGSCTARTAGDRVRQLSECIANAKVDLICCSSSDAPVLVWDALTAKFVNKIPFVLNFRGRMTHAIGVDGDRSELAGQGPRMRLFDLVLARSRVNQAYLKAMQARCLFVPPFVPADLTRREASAVAEDKRILWCARFEWSKHPGDMLSIFSEILRTVPDARLTIVGMGSKGMTDYLRKEIADRGLAERISMAGQRLSSKEHFAQAKVLLFTTTDGAVSATLVEAAAYGLPVVAYDRPDDESVRQNGGVVQVREGDVRAAAGAAIALLMDEKVHSVARDCQKQAFDRLVTLSPDDIPRRIVAALNSSSCDTSRRVEQEDLRLFLDELGEEYAKGFNRQIGNIKKIERTVWSLRDSVKTTREKLSVVNDESRAPCGEAALAREIDALKNSESYRVGLILTWPLRFLLGKIKRR